MAKVLKARTNAAGLRVVTVYQSDAAPGVTDDASQDCVAGQTQFEVVDADGKVTARYLCTDATIGAAVWKKAELDDERKSVLFIEETVTFTGTGSKNLTEQLPARAIPLYGLINCETLVGCTTAVKLGLGTAGDPDGFARTAALTKNAKQTLGKGALCGAELAAATTIAVSSVDTNGAAAGTADSGTARVRVYYELYDNLPDA